MTMPSVADAVWRVMSDELVQRQLVQRTGYWLRRPEHRITLSDGELELAHKLRAALAAGRFDPPWVRDLAARVRRPDDEVRQVLRKCVLQNEVYEIVRDLSYHSDCVRELAQVLKGLAYRHGAVEALGRHRHHLPGAACGTASRTLESASCRVGNICASPTAAVRP